VRSSLLLACWFAASAVGAANLAPESAQRGDIEVTTSLDAAEQSGSAAGVVKIHARREVVWGLLTNCAESLRLVPGLEVCDVLETAPDRSWQRIRQVMNYSWYLPKLSYQIHVAYDPPSRIAIERISGDVRTLKGSWVLQSDGDYTVAHYTVNLAPGFWVPHWLVLSVLRHDLPKLLGALRTRAEAIESQKP
jgi:Polyketide cyclase / dehydrase and lipid transport